MRLDAVDVLDLSQLLPGPYATQLLADMGATVTKIERPGSGDPARLMSATEGNPNSFISVNRGKRSATINLKSEAGREAFLRRARQADVIVEGFRPGVVDRLGIDYETVREQNPGVVYCSLTGFGATGPHRDRAGHDLNYVGMAGLLDMTRSKAGDLAIPGYPIADMAGGLFAAFAIVSALLSRELGGLASGGEGEHVDVAMTDVVAALSQPVADHALAGKEITGRETALTGELPCYDVYETADGEYATLAALEPRFWREFCEVIDRPDLVDRQYASDPAEREALREELAAEFARRTREEWDAIGDDHDAMVGPVYSVAEALDSDQVRERGLIQGEDSPEGPRVGFPAIPSGGLAPDESTPDLGEHTEAVLREAGYEAAGIEHLREVDAI